MDDGKAPDWNDLEMGNTKQWSRRWRGVGSLTGSGAWQHSRGAGHGRQEQAVAQPTTVGKSRRHDRRCFGRLDQEDQRLKKHYGRWMDIVRSLKLESFIY